MKNIIKYMYMKTKSSIKNMFQKEDLSIKETYWKSDETWNNVISLEERIENPTVLAVSAYFHGSSAAIVKDGKIIAAVAEERLSRIKNDSGFPEKSIEYCLKEAGIDKVDKIVFFEDPDEKKERINEMIYNKMPSFSLFNKIQNLWEKKSKKQIEKQLRKYSNDKPIFLKHHLSHAGSAYLVSGFDEAAILTIDGVGEKQTTTLSLGKGNDIELKKYIDFPDSAGLFYTAMTNFLGFRSNNDEYKVMGLSAFGDKDRNTNQFYKLMKDNLIDIKEDGSYKLNMKYFSHDKIGKKSFTKELSDLLNIDPRPLNDNEKPNKDYDDIAAATQLITEDIYIGILNHLYDITKSENLCISGGVALNSVANGTLLRKTPFKNLFIQPAAGDEGTVIGAAKYIQHKLDPKAPKEIFENAYLGPEFSDEEIKHFLDSNNIRYESFDKEDDLLKKSAKLLDEQNIIALYQGRSEWGPRALGNRSILADPRNKKMIEIINSKIKMREPFRPFAPAVCIDDALDYFDCDKPIQSPTDYMLMVYDVIEDKKEIIPAVTHVDGSGRLQTIRYEQNPFYYNIIKEFGELTGVSVLINTSFNIRGEPIINTPKEAFNTLMGTEIDYMIIGKYLIKREDNPEFITKLKPKESNQIYDKEI
jgi:carbamoyltransferase